MCVDIKLFTDILSVQNNAASTKKNSGLSGLLAHYDSDSETEEHVENDKLDVKVDSFLQEINSITSVESTPTISKAIKLSFV